MKNTSVFFSLINSLDNAHIDERLYKDTHDFVWQQIRDSPDIRKNITPLCVQKSTHCQKSNKESKAQSKNFIKTSNIYFYAEKFQQIINFFATYVKNL